LDLRVYCHSEPAGEESLAQNLIPCPRFFGQSPQNDNNRANP